MGRRLEFENPDRIVHGDVLKHGRLLARLAECAQGAPFSFDAREPP